MKKLKLTELSKIVGGYTTISSRDGTRSCGCACWYEQSGGSSELNNANGNYARGLNSPTENPNY